MCYINGSSAVADFDIMTCWMPVSFAASTVVHICVDRPIEALLGAGARPLVVSAIVHLDAKTVGCDTKREWSDQKHGQGVMKN